MSLASLENAPVTVVCHPPEVCLAGGHACTLHARTDHHMRTWPQHWRQDRNMMERICPHGIGHPDPDELPSVDRTHGCDGCCEDPLRGPKHPRTTVEFSFLFEPRDLWMGLYVKTEMPGVFSTEWYWRDETSWRRFVTGKLTSLYVMVLPTLGFRIRIRWKDRPFPDDFME